MRPRLSLTHKACGLIFAAQCMVWVIAWDEWMKGATDMKVGVLGSGGMGEAVIQHLKLCKDVSDIVALDVRAERIGQLKAKYQIEGTTNFRDILADSAGKLGFVTASNDAHQALTLQALEAGKAVMCEKPM